MARKLRFNVVGIPQHVIQRGNNRQATFLAEEDYGVYLDCLSAAAQKYDCAIHAYALMPNHVHLLATPRLPESIPRMMQSIGRRYVQYINYRYKRSGNLWEGRYKASLVQSEQYLLTCCRYIELNAVRANMVEHPEHYQWSSYRANALGEKDRLLTMHAEYEVLGTSPEQRQEAYRSLFLTQFDSETLTELRSAINRELIIGGEQFKIEIETALNRRVQPGRRGRPRKPAGACIARAKLNGEHSFCGSALNDSDPIYPV